MQEELTEYQLDFAKQRDIDPQENKELAKLLPKNEMAASERQAYVGYGMAIRVIQMFQEQRAASVQKALRNLNKEVLNTQRGPHKLALHYLKALGCVQNSSNDFEENLSSEQLQSALDELHERQKGALANFEKSQGGAMGIFENSLIWELLLGLGEVRF